MELIAGSVGFSNGKPKYIVLDRLWIEVNNKQSKFIDYVKKNKEQINPWLLQEAKRRKLL